MDREDGWCIAGEEREPRDGHYAYTAEKPFSLIRPLAAQNQARVGAYLEAVRAQSCF
jgi:hypothetical protein